LKAEFRINEMKSESIRFSYAMKGNLRESLNTIDLQLLLCRPVPNTIYGTNRKDEMILLHQVSDDNQLEIQNHPSSSQSESPQAFIEKDEIIKERIIWNRYFLRDLITLNSKF